MLSLFLFLSLFNAKHTHHALTHAHTPSTHTCSLSFFSSLIRSGSNASIAVRPVCSLGVWQHISPCGCVTILAGRERAIAHWRQKRDLIVSRWFSLCSCETKRACVRVWHKINTFIPIIFGSCEIWGVFCDGCWDDKTHLDTPVWPTAHSKYPGSQEQWNISIVENLISF